MKIAIDSKQVEVRKLELKRTDALCLKRPKHMRDERWTELLNMFADDCVTYLGFRTLIIGVDRTWNEIVKLSEEQMALYNWVPKDSVLAYKNDSLEDIKGKLEAVIERLELDAALGNEEEE